MDKKTIGGRGRIIKAPTISKYLQTKAAEINAQLDCWVSQLDAPPTLLESIRYSLLNGGKRIRPILLLATVDSLQGNEQSALNFACAIELIHTYSLIHDDLPCMDDDDYRRGKLTSHRVFGEAQAVLTGDALLTEAFGLISRAQNIEPSTILAIIQEGVYYTGARGMVGGQVLDIESTNKVITKNELKLVHTHKTADLMVYAVRSGAHLCAAPSHVLDILTRYAVSLGLAFQIQDDLLDVFGDPATMGKETGRDSNKHTYPAIFGLEEAQNKLGELTQKAKECLVTLDQQGIESRYLYQITDYLLTRDH